MAAPGYDGVVAHGGVRVHDTGIIGTGVKVCVVSDSVYSLVNLQAAGLLPSVDILPGQAGPLLDKKMNPMDEGTAMLEIVHAISAGATLGFATAEGSPA